MILGFGLWCFGFDNLVFLGFAIQGAGLESFGHDILEDRFLPRHHVWNLWRHFQGHGVVAALLGFRALGLAASDTLQEETLSNVCAFCLGASVFRPERCASD